MNLPGNSQIVLTGSKPLPDTNFIFFTAISPPDHANSPIVSTGIRLQLLNTALQYHISWTMSRTANIRFYTDASPAYLDQDHMHLFVDREFRLTSYSGRTGQLTINGGAKELFVYVDTPGQVDVTLIVTMQIPKPVNIRCLPGYINGEPDSGSFVDTNSRVDGFKIPVYKSRLVDLSHIENVIYKDFVVLAELIHDTSEILALPLLLPIIPVDPAIEYDFVPVVYTGGCTGPDVSFRGKAWTNFAGRPGYTSWFGGVNGAFFGVSIDPPLGMTAQITWDILVDVTQGTGSCSDGDVQPIVEVSYMDWLSIFHVHSAINTSDNLARVIYDPLTTTGTINNLTKPGPVLLPDATQIVLSVTNNLNKHSFVNVVFNKIIVTYVPLPIFS